MPKEVYIFGKVTHRCREMWCNLRSKGRGNFERKFKNCFSPISSSKVDRFMSNDHRYISPAEVLRF